MIETRLTCRYESISSDMVQTDSVLAQRTKVTDTKTSTYICVISVIFTGKMHLVKIIKSF